MTAKRLLLGAVVGAVAASAAFAQPTPPPAQPPAGTPTAGPGGAFLLPPPPGATPQLGANPAMTLAGPDAVPGVQPGTVCSPWVGNRPAGSCCGPVGANGPVTYEFYLFTGPSLPVAGGLFSKTLLTGWITGGGGRTLFFDRDGAAAWALDLGFSYTYNRGQLFDRPFDVARIGDIDPGTGRQNPDDLIRAGLRGLHRTSFNFAVGRDWFLNGPASVGAEQAGNWRFGADVGGRWGTAHVDLVPDDDRTGYTRRQDVFHGVFIGTHLDRDFPLCGAIVFTGLRAEWAYNWTNLIPPQDGNLMDVNILLRAGIRF